MNTEMSKTAPAPQTGRERRKTQYGFYFDQTACVGCRTCQIACKDKNRLGAGELLRRVKTYEVGEFPNPAIYHLAVSCAHCSHPACAAACPTGRTRVDEATGVVYHDENAPCAGEGCLRCVKACPYGHPVYVRAQKKVVKCDLCMGLIAKGQEPSCVASCMTRCLKFGPIDELKAKYGEGLVTALPCLPDGGTGPNALIRPHARAREAGFEEHRI